MQIPLTKKSLRNAEKIKIIFIVGDIKQYIFVHWLWIMWQLKMSEYNPQGKNTISNEEPTQCNKNPVSIIIIISNDAKGVVLGGRRGTRSRCDGRRLLCTSAFVKQSVVSVVKLLKTRGVVVDPHRSQGSCHLLLHLRPEFFTLA